MFTTLAYAFFSDLEDFPTTNPPKIILISPIGGLIAPHLWFPILFILLLLFIWLRFLYKFLLLSLTDQGFNLVLQMPAFISAMPVVLVESIVLAFVFYFYWSINGSRPLQRRFFFYLNQYLLNRHHQGSETSSIWEVLLFFQCMPNAPCLLLPIKFVTSSFISFPFGCHTLSSHRILYIHILLGLVKQFCHYFRRTFGD